MLMLELILLYSIEIMAINNRMRMEFNLNYNEENPFTEKCMKRIITELSLMSEERRERDRA